MLVYVRRRCLQGLFQTNSIRCHSLALCLCSIATQINQQNIKKQETKHGLWTDNISRRIRIKYQRNNRVKPSEIRQKHAEQISTTAPDIAIPHSLSIKCILIDYLITLVSVCVCLSTDRLSNDYIRNSWPIFTKFCMPLRNLVVSKAIVSGANRK